MSVVHFSTWILGIEKQKLKVRAIIHHLKIWNLTLQMSFTGSRGSFLGDSHFYGKQVKFKLLKNSLTDLKCGLIRILNVQESLVCKWSGLWMIPEIKKPNHFKSGQIAILSNYLISEQKCLDFELSGYHIVGTKAWPCENGTIKNLILKKSRFQMFPDLEWLDFQIPTVTSETVTFWIGLVWYSQS